MSKRVKTIRYRLRTSIYYDEIKVIWDDKKEFDELSQLELLDEKIGLEKIACYFIKKNVTKR